MYELSIEQLMQVTGGATEVDPMKDGGISHEGESNGSSGGGRDPDDILD